MKYFILTGMIFATTLAYGCNAKTSTGPASTPAPQISTAAPPQPQATSQTAAPTATSTPTTAQANPSANAVIKTGSFVSGEHPTQGTAKIITEGNQNWIELSGDFQTDAGPDLVVALHRANDVIGTTQAPVHALREGDYRVIEPLKSTSGTQRYLLPEGVTLADYQSVIIWCRQFNATFGAAGLGAVLN